MSPPGCISDGSKEDLQRGRLKVGDPCLTPLGFHFLPGVEELCNALSNCLMPIILLMAVVRSLVVIALVTMPVRTHLCAEPVGPPVHIHHVWAGGGAPTVRGDLSEAMRLTAGGAGTHGLLCVT